MSLLASSLLTWFTAHKRSLPWRAARNPYRIWVSEVMLQQTQVATVTPYFERWMAAFPTLGALASAPQEQVLKLWEGLGYYRRARLLHQGAKTVVSERGGVTPDTYEGLLELPGIGPYTAAAIASLAFNERVLAVDGNVKRVAARLFCLAGEVKPEHVKARLEPHMPEQAGDFNEALMELGATVCTPRSPRCDLCPLSAHCQALTCAQVTRFPEPKVRKKVPHYERFAHVALKDNRLWLYQRPSTEMLGGLWGFVLTERAPEGEQLGRVQHVYTHFKITVTPVISQQTPGTGEWVDPQDLERLPLSRLDHKIVSRLEAHVRAPLV